MKKIVLILIVFVVLIIFIISYISSNRKWMRNPITWSEIVVDFTDERLKPQAINDVLFDVQIQTDNFWGGVYTGYLWINSFSEKYTSFKIQSYVLKNDDKVLIENDNLMIKGGIDNKPDRKYRYGGIMLFDSRRLKIKTGDILEILAEIEIYSNEGHSFSGSVRIPLEVVPERKMNFPSK